MELVADYDLEIIYHPGKANSVADALSRRRSDVAAEKDSEMLVSLIGTLHLSAISEETEPLGLAVSDQADLLSRIRLAQGNDEELKRNAQTEGNEYQTSKSGMILVNGRVCVPNQKDLKDEILREAHQSRFSIHPGSTKMYRDLKRYYQWVGMKRDVAEWVAKCMICQQVKAEHQYPSGLLQNLPIPEWKWDHVAMDFITGLPRTKYSKDAIWVIVDRLTKSAHFIAMRQTDSVEWIAGKYLDEIVKLHGVPASIVSDRDTRFTSNFWRAFQKALGTRVNMSTAYHPQTDGQSERTIQTLEDMLRACVLEWGGTWEKYLPLAEFAYNNSFQTSIGMSPYEALYGRPCRTPLCWTEVGERQLMGPEIVDKTMERIQFLKVKMKEAQDRQKSYSDKRRKDLKFSVGDWVYLKVATMKGRARTSKEGKLKPRYMGPFQIMERIGEVAYKLELPTEMSAFHNVFHVSQLRKCLKEQDVVIREHPTNLTENLVVEAKPIRVLEREVKLVKRRKVLRLRVLWECDGTEEITWENADHMKEKFPKWYGKQLGSDSGTNPI